MRRNIWKTNLKKKQGITLIALVNTNSTVTIGDNDIEVGSVPSIKGLNNCGIGTTSNVNFSLYNGEIIGKINPPYMNVDTYRTGKTTMPVTSNNGMYIAKYTN